MTEQEWLACEDPKPMLHFLWGIAASASRVTVLETLMSRMPSPNQRLDERKLRLFVGDCFRHAAAAFEPKSAAGKFLARSPWLEILDASDRFADGLPADELVQLGDQLPPADDFGFVSSHYMAQENLLSALFSISRAREAAWLILLPANLAGSFVYELMPRESQSQSAWQCVHLREVVGNPFSPVSLDPAWLTPDVVALARGIYDDRAFDRMPILADALQDAGCDNPDVLNHCRGENVHARGCWVVDLLLGKM